MPEQPSKHAPRTRSHPASSWTSGTLSDVIADVRGGFSVNCEDRPAGIDEIGVLKTGSVLNGRFRPEENKVVLANELERTRTRVSSGRIIICRKNSEEVVGASALVNEDYPNLFLSDLLWQITPTPGVSIYWLSATISSDRVRSLIRISATGTQASMKNISQDRLLAIPVQIPPLAEQNRIAAVLRTWDEAIEKLQALRDAKRRRQTALTQALVLGSLRLGNYRQTTETTSHRWFTLPADWSCSAIGKIAVEISERQGAAEPAEVLSCSKHDGFVRSLEYFKKQVYSADLANYKRIWRNDFGFPSNHVEEGSIGLQNLVDVGVVSPIYTVFRFAADVVDPSYAYAVLKTGLYRHIFEVSTSASVDRRGSLRWGEFSLLPFPLPSLLEQRAIVEVLNTASAEIAGLDGEIEALSSQKRGLMQKLLTGEWRVAVEGVAA